MMLNLKRFLPRNTWQHFLIIYIYLTLSKIDDRVNKTRFSVIIRARSLIPTTQDQSWYIFILDHFSSETVEQKQT